MDDPWFVSQHAKKNLYSANCSDLLRGQHSLIVNGNRSYFLLGLAAAGA
jgi:hypothetical protein